MLGLLVCVVAVGTPTHQEGWPGHTRVSTAGNCSHLGAVFNVCWVKVAVKNEAKVRKDGYVYSLIAS